MGLLEEHAAADEAGKARLEEKNIAALVGDMHRADIADFLESLPKDKRPVIWRGLPTEKRALVVIEVSEPVRADIIEQTPDEETAAPVSPDARRRCGNAFARFAQCIKRPLIEVGGDFRKR